jgi:exodeoxyribonuclease VII large subunit
MTGNTKILTLSDLTQHIRRSITENFKQPIWIKAEMNKVNFYRQSGHAYPELVEKLNGKIIAQMRCNLWSSEYQEINRNFLRTLKEPLKDGIKILLLANVSFDPVYGLSLRILDIDPSYTLGDLEMERQQTIERLRNENIFSTNKQRFFPLLPKRIAVISDLTSKGYADFLHVINGNEWNFKFSLQLFSAVLQGPRAIETIIEQLKFIKKLEEFFDVVVIVRGGGADIGLSSYNNYDLSKEIALFPIPVLTGIGHSTNETVSELVAFSNSITPTKLAEYLLQYYRIFSDTIQGSEEKIKNYAANRIREEKNKFASAIRLFQSSTKSMLAKSKSEINIMLQSVTVHSRFFTRQQKEKLFHISNGLPGKTASFLQNNKSFLEFMQKNVANLSPEMVLKRGYSITLFNGKSVKNIDSIKPGDRLHTRVADGSIFSSVLDKSKSDE